MDGPNIRCVILKGLKKTTHRAINESSLTCSNIRWCSNEPRNWGVTWVLDFSIKKRSFHWHLRNSIWRIVIWYNDGFLIFILSEHRGYYHIICDDDSYWIFGSSDILFPMIKYPSIISKSDKLNDFTLLILCFLRDSVDITLSIAGYCHGTSGRCSAKFIGSDINIGSLRSCVLIKIYHWCKSVTSCINTGWKWL